MNGLVIRCYRETDDFEVIELWKACDLIVPWNNPSEDIKRKIADSRQLFFVGELKESIVATCMSGYDGHRGWIYYLAVKPEVRRQGIGSMMMNHAESALKGLGCPKIELMVRQTNLEVILFYKMIEYGEEPVRVLSKRLYHDEPHE